MEIIAAVLASGAVFSFVQFLITFGFSRRDHTKELESKIDKLSERIDENAAILARTHILRFSDELKNGVSSIKYAQALKGGGENADKK